MLSQFDPESATEKDLNLDPGLILESDSFVRLNLISGILFQGVSGIDFDHVKDCFLPCLFEFGVFLANKGLFPCTFSIDLSRSAILIPSKTFSFIYFNWKSRMLKHCGGVLLLFCVTCLDYK